MPPDLDASLLRSFLACARAGSISRAAAALGRTQPALSQQLRRLEDIMGKRLLRRMPIGVALTPAGEALLPYAERILALSAEAYSDVGRGKALAGHCGIGLIEDLATPSLARLLADFVARHPQVTLEVVTLPGPAMRQAFDDGRIQIVLGDPEYFGPPPIWTKQLPILWAAASGFDRAANPLPLALFSQPCRWREPVLRALDAAGRPWRIAFESTGLAGVLAGVRAGLGAGALLPGTIGSDLVLLDRTSGLPSLPDIEVGLVRRPGTDGMPLVDTISTLLQDLV